MAIHKIPSRGSRLDMRQNNDVFDIRQWNPPPTSVPVEAHGRRALRFSRSGTRHQQAGLCNQAALVMAANTSATVSPNEDGVGTIVTPAPLRISTFSWADSPKAEMIAPA